MLRKSWSAVPLDEHVMYGWNKGEPQPGPVPNGYLTCTEPHVLRQEEEEEAAANVGGDKSTKRVMRRMGGGGGVIIGLVSSFLLF